MGLLKRFEGAVEVLGADARARDRSLYERTGVSFEFPTLFSKLTGRENLAFFASLYSVDTKDPDELLALMDLKAAADKRLGDYSKGMKQRLNVARALVNDPDLIFLDEPTSGLDPVNRRRIRDLILELKRQGKTIVLTTHDMVTAAQVSDRVAFMVDGKIPAIGSPRTLMLEHGKKTVRVEHRVDGTVAFDEFPLATLGSDERFLGLLKTGTIETIHTEEATLEDVFVRVTGRRLG